MQQQHVQQSSTASVATNPRDSGNSIIIIIIRMNSSQAQHLSANTRKTCHYSNLSLADDNTANGVLKVRPLLVGTYESVNMSMDVCIYV